MYAMLPQRICTVEGGDGDLEKKIEELAMGFVCDGFGFSVCKGRHPSRLALGSLFKSIPQSDTIDCD